METTNSSTSEWLGCSLQRDGMISTLPKLQTNLNQIGPCVKNCSNKGYFDLWTHNICQVWYWMIQEMASIDLNQWKFGLSYVINIHYIIVYLYDIWLLCLLYLHGSAPEPFSAGEWTNVSGQLDSQRLIRCFRNPAPQCRGTSTVEIQCRCRGFFSWPESRAGFLSSVEMCTMN